MTIVNDGSTDRSEKVLKKYIFDKRITILNQENRGLSGARNTGLKDNRGRYVMFVDSDDFLTENAIQSLLDTAYALSADIVQGSYCNIDGDTEAYLGSMIYEDCASVLPNGVVAGMAWGKVYKSTLFTNVCFPENYWYEDTIITGIVTHLARQIATISDVVYYYRRNKEGITKSSTGKPKSIDTFWVQRSVLTARAELGLRTDKDFYEHLLRMVILTYQRTEKEPYEVKKRIFSSKEMLQKEKRVKFVVNNRYKKLEEAIFEGDFRKYCLMCKIWCY